jgi:hypothetical protein
MIRRRSAAEGGCGPQVIKIWTAAQRRFRCVLCFWGCDPLPDLSAEMGIKWGGFTQGLCLQQGRMGTRGEDSCKSFRNGEQGRGRVFMYPQLHKKWPDRRHRARSEKQKLTSKTRRREGERPKLGTERRSRTSTGRSACATKAYSAGKGACGQPFELQE